MKKIENLSLKKESVARLLSCQALCMYYNPDIDNKDINSILESINNYYILDNYNDENNCNNYSDVYKSKFVNEIINGVILNSEKYDTLINKLLNKQDTTETLEEVILQCFRLAYYELENIKNLDKNIIVNEYVDLVSEFYNSVYINFSNGILNNMALIIRDNVDINSIINSNSKKVSNPVISKRKLITLNKKYEG